VIHPMAGTSGRPIINIDKSMNPCTMGVAMYPEVR